MDFIKGLIEGKPLADVTGYFGGLWEQITNLDVLAKVVELWKNNVADYKHYIFLALALVIVLLGQKLMGAMKFVASFVLGAGLGIDLLSDIVVKIGLGRGTAELVSAAVCGVVAAILFKVVYIAAIVLVGGYVAYDVVLTGAIKALASIKGNQIIAAAAAVVLVALVLVFRKFFERLGTSALGGWIIACQVFALWGDKLAKITDGKEAMFKLIIMGVLAVVGLIIQIKTRKKY